MVLSEELGPRASGTLENLKTFALIVGLIVPSLVIGYYYGAAPTPAQENNTIHSCLFDGNSPGCIPPFTVFGFDGNTLGFGCFFEKGNSQYSVFCTNSFSEWQKPIVLIACVGCSEDIQMVVCQTGEYYDSNYDLCISPKNFVTYPVRDFNGT
ncbi:MAG: hypothetical protein UX13_C0003G0018 [Candidatus Woesebacteria bacterium GW2011_GWB1_45_5]|uniref:Uncharacterized protein n=1 Tax=Candidatus Woesebacteria bacterium GW2011_GWB1_45_5 TaxID=1618581 RepID=A0A0G1MR29_9BACT|nr:MAG: hypothetical protein UX13_C0003G0018 [Candidatus Woesebacteria bacterium GW2011_GWB1_45_5]